MSTKKISGIIQINLRVITFTFPPAVNPLIEGDFFLNILIKNKFPFDC